MNPFVALIGFCLAALSACSSASKNASAPAPVATRSADPLHSLSTPISATPVPIATPKVIPSGTTLEQPSPSPARERVYTPVGKTPKRPAWIDPKNPFEIKDGEVHTLGQTVTPPGASIEEGYIIASNSAKEALCKATEYRLDFIFQDSEEGSTVDHKQIKEITMDVCTGVAAITKPGKRYWEKVMTTASNGDRVIVYRVFVTDMIPEKKFKSLVARSIKKQEGKGKIPKDYAKVFRRKRWAAFVKGE